jgi:hypothetical protein
MRLHRPQKFRRLLPATCRYCDQRFFYKAGGRPRLFCDHICQQRDFRRLKGDTGFRDESREKNQVRSTISKVDFADRPPVEILCRGHRWSGQSIDRQLVAAIIETENPEKRIIRSASPPNPYIAQIPADLSIPAFLRRRPS